MGSHIYGALCQTKMIAVRPQHHFLSSEDFANLEVYASFVSRKATVLRLKLLYALHNEFTLLHKYTLTESSLECYLNPRDTITGNTTCVMDE